MPPPSVEIAALRRTTVVIDNFVRDPDALRAYALAQDFKADNRYFRGQRTECVHKWPGFQQSFERLLGRSIVKWDSPVNGVFQFAIGGEQLVYHSDHNTHAAILYLTPGAPVECGTTLYKSKQMQARSVKEYMEAGTTLGYPDEQIATRMMYENKLLDKTAWEPVDVIGNVYNRLMIWDAKMVHAASGYFGHSKETARLWQMFFFDCE